jgi:hypothetical protein
MSSEVRYFRISGEGSVRGWGGFEGGVERSPDAAGEVAFEAADSFSFGLFLAVSAVEMETGRGVGAGAGERDDVEGPV